MTTTRRRVNPERTEPLYDAQMQKLDRNGGVLLGMGVLLAAFGCESNSTSSGSSTESTTDVESPPKTNCERAGDRFADLLKEGLKKSARSTEGEVLSARSQLVAECTKAGWSKPQTDCYINATADSFDQCRELATPKGTAIARVEFATQVESQSQAEGMDFEVRARGEGHKTVRFIHAKCSAKMLEFFLKMAKNMRNVGFTNVECFDGNSVVASSKL